MKKVRICPVCGWCNTPNNHQCDHCHAIIDFDLVEVSRVDDGIDQVALTLPPEKKTENPKDPEPIKARTCPHCSKGVSEGEMFCPDCGFPIDGSLASEPNQNINLMIDGTSVLLLTFAQGYLYFGRKYTSHVAILANPYISSLHLVFFSMDGHIYVQDVSSNGTSLNGEKMTRGLLYPFNIGDRLLLEYTTLQMQTL